MEYLFLLYSDEKQWSKMSKADQEKGVAAYGAYTEALKKAGIYKGSNRLASASSATTVHVANGEPLLLGRPGAGSEARLAGYYMAHVADLDPPLSRARRTPAARPGPVQVRSRP